LQTTEATEAWLLDVEQALGAVRWEPLGGTPNNVHPVEVASDPALALVERPINGIDALLDLAAREHGATAPTPHEAAEAWLGVPPGGIGKLDQNTRRRMADSLRITMLESGEAQRPTIEVRDGGTGQHPDDFEGTLLSLLASNKKEKRHQMGVYNAGGAASYRFAQYAVIASRLAPTLLDGRRDEAGVTVVRYNPLDPERYKTGRYEYLVGADGGIIRLTPTLLPESDDDLESLPYGTIVRLVEYQIPRYARGAHEPKQSLWHLFHAALPDPALPMRVVETRSDRFPGVRGQERRVIAGLLYQLRRAGVADYSDERELDLGPDLGTVTLRYFVVNEDGDPDAYTTSEQGLTITLNGQRQVTKDRQWVKRTLELPFLFSQLVILVDGTSLTASGKRQVFSSTRESGVDSPATKLILDRVISELREDDVLVDLDEARRQRVVEKATRTTSDKVKRRLAGSIGRYLRGDLGGTKGGRKRKRRRRRGRPGPGPLPPDDSHLLDVPDVLRILTERVEIEPGATASLRLEINGKNGFLPDHAESLSVVIGPELAQHVHLRSKGRLLGGHTRLTLIAGEDAPIAETSLKVALVVPDLGLILMGEAKVAVVPPPDDRDEPDDQGGEPDVYVSWVGRDKWPELGWDADDVGICNVFRDDPEDKAAITRVEWILNEGFTAYEQVVRERRLSEGPLRTFQEGYEFPVLYGLFRQQLAEERHEAELEDSAREGDVSRAYAKGERARLARAVLMAMEPEVVIAEAAESG
jgi:hypothetical protein